MSGCIGGFLLCYTAEKQAWKEGISMAIQIRAYQDNDIDALIAIWNEVVEAGTSFPQLEPLTVETGKAFFAEQSFTAAAYDDETGEIVGLYILHPNHLHIPNNQ